MSDDNDMPKEYADALSVLSELPALDVAMQLSQELIESQGFEIGETVWLNITEPPMRVVIANEPMFWGRIAIHQTTDIDGKKHGPQLVEIGWLSKVSCDNKE